MAADEVDTTGLTRPQQVEYPMEGIRTEQVATVRLHAALPDGRTILIMPTGDARGVVPKSARIIWHERMNQTPQEVALAGAVPTSGAEIMKPLTETLVSPIDLATRLAGVETAIQKIKEELAGRLTPETLAEREAELEDLKAAAAGRVRTTLKSPGPAATASTPTEKAK